MEPQTTQMGSGVHSFQSSTCWLLLHPTHFWMALSSVGNSMQKLSSQKRGGLWTDSPDKSCPQEILQLNRRPITRISKQALGLSTS